MADQQVLQGKQVELKIERTNQALETAPVIAVDGAQGFIHSEHGIKFNLFQDLLTGGVGHQEGAPIIERVVCARIVMSQAVFLSFADWITKISADLKDGAGQRQ